jgi:hypothetical protein
LVGRRDGHKARRSDRARTADRRRARQISMTSFAIGAAVALVAVLLPF